MLALFTLATGAMSGGALPEQMQWVLLGKNIAIAGGLLQLAALGAGRWSIDFS
ncbi:MULTISPECIES: hypothetical protein [unclassified Sphingobium]|uniref:hypothetical protein n=1 Tax=unclassified Sphingobium TaxID=2611147 RepID=UPI0035A5E5CE